jgi:hypothetical protein
MTDTASVMKSAGRGRSRLRIDGQAPQVGDPLVDPAQDPVPVEDGRLGGPCHQAGHRAVGVEEVVPGQERPVGDLSLRLAEFGGERLEELVGRPGDADCGAV